MPDVTFPFTTQLSRDYRYAFRCHLAAGTWRYGWEIVGAKGGVSLHISGPHVYDNTDHWDAGLEYHSRTPRGSDKSPPSHDECWLLHAPCWHDGTSLYARETYLPLFHAGEFGYIFQRLVGDARRYFEETPDA